MAAFALTDPGPQVVLAAQGRRREVPWGQPWQCGTAAHWIALTREADGAGERDPLRHRLGASLREEVTACLLGGFGLPFEIGLAAFGAVRDEGLLASRSIPAAEKVEAVLRRPLHVGGRWQRYRFPAQRASRVAAALAFLDREIPPSAPLAVRNWLLGAPGIGPKTASWIVRNHYGSDEVAVLDVHVMRAGTNAGVFDPAWSVTRDYWLMEGFFLSWANHGSVPAGDLDAVIWAEQAELARSVRLRRTPHDPRTGESSYADRSHPPRPRSNGVIY